MSSMSSIFNLKYRGSICHCLPLSIDKSLLVANDDIIFDIIFVHFSLFVIRGLHKKMGGHWSCLHKKVKNFLQGDYFKETSWIQWLNRNKYWMTSCIAKKRFKKKIIKFEIKSKNIKTYCNVLVLINGKAHLSRLKRWSVNICFLRPRTVCSAEAVFYFFKAFYDHFRLLHFLCLFLRMNWCCNSFRCFCTRT